MRHHLLLLNMFLLISPTAVSAQSAAAGAQQFKTKCSVCHSTKAGAKPGMGPNLAGVAGRNSASTAFQYSPALKKAKLKWTAEQLNAFLSGPSKLVPGTRMAVSVPDAKQRADLVAYLLTLK